MRFIISLDCAITVEKVGCVDPVTALVTLIEEGELVNYVNQLSDFVGFISGIKADYPSRTNF
jgi:hypothetical protein